MGEFADEYVDRMIGDYWGGGYRHQRFYSRPKPAKKTNAQIFAAYARDGINFKAGDRVVHKPSAVAGVVVSVRGSQVCWRPDTRLKPGGIYVDAGSLRFDI